MKTVCLMFHKSRSGGVRRWMGLAFALILTVLTLYPMRVDAAASNPGLKPDMPPAGMTAEMPENAMPGPTPDGMPNDPSAGGAADAPDAMAFPGLTTDSFGPSPITPRGILTLAICIAFLCVGTIFCVTFRRGKKSF